MKATVLAGYSQEAVLSHQYDEVIECDTIGEAKRKARYVLTDEYQRLVEASSPMTYSQVVVDGECLHDYFRK